MNSTNNYGNGATDFEFVETSPMPYEEVPSEFEETSSELEVKSDVLIFTTHYRMAGKIALVPGARLTDYMNESHQFMAVTDVEVRDKAGKLLLTTPFLDVNRDYIELIIPKELVSVADAA